MKVMKWSAIALAVSAGSTQFAVADAFVSDQAEAKGFIEDSSLNLLLRNYYFNRDGQVHGDEPFDYIGFGGNGSGAGGDSIFLANSVQYSDFNGPGEKSWQARYDLNLASYGVPGLTFMLRYINGKDIDGTKVDSSSSYAGLYGEDGKHHETNLEAKYVVQSGPAKDLSFRIRQAWHRANADQGEGDQNEFRLIVDYPLSIL
ncbi:TPA: OprD family outer membrane porin [Pseudomonas aeruginosa]